MNANCYKIIFSKRLGTLVAVGEHTSSTGKAASGQACRSSAMADGFVGALRFTFASVALVCLSLGHSQAQSTAVALASTALPQGGSISTGSATISANGAAMAINQSTDKASINWQSFNIGSAASVNIAQPSANSVLLNRVVGNDPSKILGKLSANGQVILLNPNGVMFGKDGSVTASSFTASTFALNDADFMAGYYKYARNGSNAAVVNQGTIETSAGGFVALIGATVTNEGTIRAPQGDVVMAAAESVTLPEELVKSQPVTTPHTVSVRMSKRVRLELDPAAINTAVNNTESGVVVTEGGQVLMQAAALSTAVASVTHSGRIDSSAPQAGAVTLLADHGVIRVDGSITANSSGHDGQGQANKGGDIIIGRDDISGQLAASTDVSGAKLESQKGFVETSGDHLTTDGISVKAAEWLLDPSDITISSSTDSNVTGVSPADITPNGGTGTSSIVQVDTIQTAINAGTNVTIKTTNALNSTGAGNITIANALSLNNTGAQDATLTLIADNGIIQNAAITGTGSKLVNINMTANGNYQGNTAANANSKGIALNAGITTNGAITLTGNNQSGATGATGAGVSINGQTVNAGSSDVTIIGTATNGNGAYINGTTSISGSNITINGTTNSVASNSNTLAGVFILNNATTRIDAGRNLEITGKAEGTGVATGAGARNGLRISSSFGGLPIAVLMTAGGTATLNGFQRGNTSDTSSAMYLSGFRVNATGDVTLKAEAANSNSLAIHMAREAGTLNGYDDSWRMQVRSSGGNVLIQSNQGAVLGQDISGGVNISGRNVTMDNTGAGMTVNGVANANGGSIDSATGAIVLGSGTSTYSTAVANGWAGSWVPLGVSLSGQNSTSSVTASGNLTIGGSSSVAQGLVVGSAVSAGANIHLASRTTAANTIGLNISQAMTAAGSIGLTGESTNASPGVGLNIGAEVKTTNNNSTTTLTSTTGAVSGTGKITTAAGNTGTMTVNTTTGGILSGQISGGGSLVKQGAGTTTLTGANSYTGTTTISGGTLQIGNGGTTGTLGTGAVSMAANSNLNFYRSDTSQFSVNNAISSASAGAGTINFMGTGVQNQSAYALGGNNSNFSGSVNLTSSRLQIANANQLGNGAASINVNSGAGLLVNSITLSNALTLAGNGWNESTGYLGALRLYNASYAGNITLGADARISAYGSIGNVTGAIGGANNLDFYSGEVRLANNSNSYTGTTITGGTLSVGNGGTTGSLGTGSVTNNANLTFNRSNTLTLSNAISGTGAVNQTGGGTTILTGSNSYAGTTTISGGTLQIGDGGATGTLGSGSVVLSNGRNLVFNRNVDTVVNNAISGNGHVSATITGNLDVANTVNLTTANNTVNLTASGNITQSAGSISATNLYLTATNGSIATSTNRINSNVTNLAMTSSGDQFATQTNTLSLAARTTGNGNIDVKTTNGTLTVNSTINGINGVTASGSGNITLEGTSSSSHGIYIDNRSITSVTGDVSLTGNTSSTTSQFGGVRLFSANVTGKNVTVEADSTGTTGNALGYWTGSSNLDATAQLRITGTSLSTGTGNGVYQNGGRLSSGTGMIINGTSQGNNSAVGLVGNMTITNGSSGGISITGTANDGQSAINLTNSTVTNGGGNVVLDAVTGNVVFDGASSNTLNNNGTGAVQIQAGNGIATDSGAIDGTKLTITQNGSGGVQVRTSGAGNITAPKIVNTGTGNVIVAAGSSVAAGTGTGGQVLTLSGNTITNNSGKTYIYSGSAANTGVLSNLSADFATLYYQGTSHAVNTAFNKSYDGTPANDLSAPAGGSITNGAQAFFRSTTKPGFSLAVDDLTKAYGDADPTTFNVTGGATTLTSNYAGVGGNNTFAVASADVLAALTGTRVVGENVGSYAYTLDGAAMNATLSAQPDLNITKRDITLTSVTAADKQYNGDTVATINGGVFGNLVGVETLSVSGSAVYADPNAGNGKVVSVADVTTLNKVNGTGLWSNYNLSTTGGVSGTGNITQAPLTLTVNNSSVFVTQNASTATNNGFSYSGFVNGDTSAVLTGAPTRTYSGAANYLIAGTYQGVLGASNVPTATNYAVTTVVAGDLVVTPADKLLIGIGSQTNAYGSQTASNLGTAASGTVSARYCFVANNCNGANLVDLTVTQLSTNQWKATDNTGSYVVFSTSLDTPSYSSGGYLNVGNYTYTASEIAPLSLTNGNFTGRATNGGVLTVNPLAVNLSHATVSKAYDGTTALPAANQPNNTLTASNAKSGDALSVSFVSGAYASNAASASASFSLLGVQLTGNDASNYSLANYANSTYTATGVITNGSSDGGKTPFVHPPKPIIPTDNSFGAGTSGGESTSGNPYLVIPAGRPSSADRCTPNTLEDCLCETQEPQPIEGLAICYQPKKTASSTSSKAKRS